MRRRPDGGTPLSAVDQLIDILPHPVYLLLSALERDRRARRREITALDVAPAGEVRAVIRSGATLATLIVTLRGRARWSPICAWWAPTARSPRISSSATS